MNTPYLARSTILVIIPGFFHKYLVAKGDIELNMSHFPSTTHLCGLEGRGGGGGGEGGSREPEKEQCVE